MTKQLKAASGLACVLGRILLCTAVLAMVLGYTGPSIYVMAQRLSSAAIGPQIVLYGTVGLLTAAALSIVLGFQARIGAVILLVFLALSTYFCHGLTFWNVVSDQARQQYVVHLVLNLSMMGAMLLICVNGSGRMSFDGKAR
jgi:putative oxidoreductase